MAAAGSHCLSRDAISVQVPQIPRRQQAAKGGCVEPDATFHGRWNIRLETGNACRVWSPVYERRMESSACITICWLEGKYDKKQLWDQEAAAIINVYLKICSTYSWWNRAELSYLSPNFYIVWESCKGGVSCTDLALTSGDNAAKKSTSQSSPVACRFMGAHVGIE